MIDLEADLVPEDPAPEYSIVNVSGTRIDADMEKVANFCASQIRTKSRAFIDSTYGTKTAEQVNPAKPLNAAELHRAAVALHLEMVEVMSNPEADFERIIEDIESQEWQQAEFIDEAAYVYDEESGFSDPTLVFRQKQSRRTRNRGYKHEMAHHIQRTHVAAAIYNAETVVCNERNGFKIRHAIAKMVEEKV